MVSLTILNITINIILSNERKKGVRVRVIIERVPCPSARPLNAFEFKHVLSKHRYYIIL